MRPVIAFAQHIKKNITLAEIVTSLRKKLLVEKKQTKRYLRSLISVSDDRQSAKAVGVTLGIVLLSFVAVAITLADIQRFCLWFMQK